MNDLKPIRVLLADSTELRLQLLQSALRRHHEFKVDACALDSDAILQQFRGHMFDVVIVGSDGTELGKSFSLLRRLNLAHPSVSTVLLVDRIDRDLVVNAFRSGAHGILCYAGNGLSELCKCIRRAYEGQVWANSQQLQYLLEELTHVPSLRVVNASGDALLSEREEQVVSLVADGLTNREIAHELGLSENTVKKYVFRIFDKLGISTRVELVLYAFNHGRTREAELLLGS